MSNEPRTTVSPVGATASEAAARRALRSPEYRAERERLREFEDIARLVISLRGKRGLTQQQLAGLVGTRHSAISRVESGQHKTSVETLRRIAQALDARLVVGFESGPVEKPERDLVTI